MVVIVYLVPSLFIEQDELPVGGDVHVGTNLDIGLTLAVLEEGRYRTLTKRLRRSGFRSGRENLAFIAGGTRCRFNGGGPTLLGAGDT